MYKLVEFLSNSNWLSVIGWLASIYAISFFIRSATKDFDEDLTPEFRIRLACQLNRVVNGDSDWLFSFDSLFTRIFGTNHLSWLCFSRSMAISGLLFAILTTATNALVINGSQFGDLVGQGSILGSLLWLLLLFIVGMVINGILDYLSLWVTRLVIRLSLPRLVKIAITFTFISIVVRIIFACVLGLVVFSGLSMALRVDSNEAGGVILLAFLLYGLQFMEFPPQFGSLAFVIFATSFSTAIWLALHLLSGLLIRWIPGAVARLNAEEAPARAIGIVCIGLVWLLGLSGGTLYFLYSWTSPS